MATIDTNVLLRWVLNDVPTQAVAAEALLTNGEQHLVPDEALIETVFVLDKVMGLSRATVVASVELVMGVAQLSLDRALWRTALNDYLAHPKLSISDTFLTAIANATRQLPLYTFDKKLVNQLDGADCSTRAALLPTPDCGPFKVRRFPRPTCSSERVWMRYAISATPSARAASARRRSRVARWQPYCSAAIR